MHDYYGHLTLGYSQVPDDDERQWARWLPLLQMQADIHQE